MKLKLKRDQGKYGTYSANRVAKDVNTRIEEAEERVREFFEERESGQPPSSPPRPKQ